MFSGGVLEHPAYFWNLSFEKFRNRPYPERVHKGLLQSNKYKSFIEARNQALEKIHQHAQTDISRLLYSTLLQVEQILLHLAYRGHQTVLNYHSIVYQSEQGTYPLFFTLAHEITKRIKRMRVSVYALSYLGQVEGIGQAAQIKPQRKLSKKDLADAQKAKTLLGEDLASRISHDVMALRDRILKAFRLGILQELPNNELMDKIRKQFPEIVGYKRPPRELTSLLREAADSGNNDAKFFNPRFIDDNDWDQIVNDYKDTLLPPSRFDSEPIDGVAEGTDVQRQYSWEAEQDLTDDFVNQVRNGEVDAANDMGIEEFVWVAILDNKTDDCCAERNGLTTSEIQTKLEGGDFSSDCDALYPPAHANCRCSLSPVASTSEVQGPDWASFKDWLDT